MNPAPEPAPRRCPRRANPGQIGGRISADLLWGEPFRLFFPLAVLAGIIGVGVWPVALWGGMELFPNVIHTRLLVLGFFGGFVFGFLGTSMPRLLETPPFSQWETLPLLVLHAAAVAAFTANAIGTGDGLFAANALLLLLVLARRIPRRKSLPAPGFCLVLPGMACLFAGLALAALGRREPLEPAGELLFRLLTYHGFVLLCLLGAGGFLLPRFLGLGFRRAFDDGRQPARGWWLAAGGAVGTGLLIAATYVLEAMEHTRLGTTLRALLVVGYLLRELPLERLRFTRRGVDWMLVTGIACLPSGILAGGWWPELRVGLAHVELIGGFTMITLGVATRVVFGHSGNRALLERFHPGITLAAGLMLLGAATRIVGEWIPRLMVSHYIYGAVCWVGGLVLWAVCVLPKVTRPDPEG